MIIVKIVEDNGLLFDSIEDEPAQTKEKIEGHYEMLKKMKEEGKFLGGYYLPGDGRSVMVFNFDDESEVDKSFFDDPMTQLLDSEVHVGVPVFEHIERLLSETL